MSLEKNIDQSDSKISLKADSIVALKILFTYIDIKNYPFINTKAV